MTELFAIKPAAQRYHELLASYDAAPAADAREASARARELKTLADKAMKETRDPAEQRAWCRATWEHGRQARQQ
mgnify:CR=1 FL=1